MADFAPTPLHGAAYAVVIQNIGGINAIGNCSSPELYQAIREKLDALRAWAATQPKPVRDAYVYGIQKVDADAQGRLKIYTHSREVTAALLTIPTPGGESGK